MCWCLTAKAFLLCLCFVFQLLHCIFFCLHSQIRPFNYQWADTTFMRANSSLNGVFLSSSDRANKPVSQTSSYTFLTHLTLTNATKRSMPQQFLGFIFALKPPLSIYVFELQFWIMQFIPVNKKGRDWGKKEKTILQKKKNQSMSSLNDVRNPKLLY